MNEIIFWGATGQAKVLYESIYGGMHELVALFDNDRSVRSSIQGVPIYYGWNEFNHWYQSRISPSRLGFAVAIGGKRGKDRYEIQERLSELGLEPIPIVHPTAFVARSSVLGKGTQILAQSSVCVDTVLGDATIINTGAVIDHECVLGKGVHVAPGAKLAGEVVVGDYATIYTGAVVLPRVKIGLGAVVGAGAVVLHDVAPNSVVVGNPARIIGSNS